jgi:hypothetical protein
MQLFNPRCWPFACAHSFGFEKKKTWKLQLSLQPPTKTVKIGKNKIIEASTELAATNQDC